MTKVELKSLFRIYRYLESITDPELTEDLLFKQDLETLKKIVIIGITEKFGEGGRK